jgi:hypothetical protein
MNLPEDLKDYSADQFQLVRPEDAGIALLVILAIAMVLDVLFR